MSSRWFCVVPAASGGVVPSAQVRHVARTLSVAVRAARRPGARGHGHSGQRRRAGCHVMSFTQVNGYVEVQAGAVCKTVGSAYVGSNPTPATRFRRSKPVTLDGVTGFWRERERLRRPSAVVRGLCVGRIRPSPGFGPYRFRYRLTCGNASDGWRLHAVARACQERRPWAMPGTGDRFTYIWRTGSGWCRRCV